MIKRRGFLKMGGMASVAAATLCPKRAFGAVDDTKVYSRYDAAMVSGTTVNDAVVKAAVESCLMAMAGRSTVADAVRTIFPGATAGSRIAVKINCLNANISPRFESVRALIECLKTVVSAPNIWLFDNTLWTTAKVDRAYGASNLNALGIWHGEDTYGSPQISVGGRSLYVSERMAQADYGVSFAALKPHQYYAGHLSGVIKNLMGAVSTQTGSYAMPGSSNPFHSGANGFRDLMNNYYKDKIKLYFVDMIFGAKHENYSSWTKVVKRITAGASPSRVDAYVVQALKNAGLTDYSPDTSVPSAVGPVNYSLVNVTAGTAADRGHEKGAHAPAAPLSADPNPFRGAVTLTLGRQWKAGAWECSIFSPQGRQLESRRLRLPAARSFTWNAAGRPPGVYVARVRAGGRVFSRRLVLTGP